MDDPDPVITEKDVPSFDLVERIIKEIDNIIIVYRVYYLFNSFIFRFQLIKKDKMCILEIPRALLENQNKNGGTAEQELTTLVYYHVENADCWSEFQA
jgi:hypothetical protein